MYFFALKDKNMEYISKNCVAKYSYLLYNLDNWKIYI